MNGRLVILFGAMQTVTMSCFIISFPYFIKYKEDYLSMFNLTLIKSQKSATADSFKNCVVPESIHTSPYGWLFTLMPPTPLEIPV